MSSSPLSVLSRSPTPPPSFALPPAAASSRKRGLSEPDLDIEEKREERAPKRIRKPSVRALEAAAAAATKVAKKKAAPKKASAKATPKKEASVPPPSAVAPSPAGPPAARTRGARKRAATVELGEEEGTKPAKKPKVAPTKSSLKKKKTKTKPKAVNKMKKVRFEIEDSRSRTLSSQPQPQPEPKPDPDAILAAFELQRQRQLQPQPQPEPQSGPAAPALQPASPVSQPPTPVSQPAAPAWIPQNWVKMAPAAYLPIHNKLYFAHGVDMNQVEMLRLHGDLILDDDWPPSQRLGSITGYEWFISNKFTPKIAPSPSPTEKVYGVVYQVDQLAIESFTEMGKVYDMQMKMMEVTYYKPDFESNIGPPPMVEGEKVLAYCLVGEWAEGDKEVELEKDGDGKVVGEKAYYRQVDKMSPLGQLLTGAIVEANVTLKMPMSYIRDHIRRFIEEPRDTVESGYHAFNNQRSDRCCVNRKY